MKLTAACDKLGVELRFPKEKSEIISPDCILFDLNDSILKPFELISSLDKINKIVFLGLVNKISNRIQKKASQSKIDLILPKPLFCQNLGMIVKQIKHKN